jgi:hypothetical protein
MDAFYPGLLHVHRRPSTTRRRSADQLATRHRGRWRHRQGNYPGRSCRTSRASSDLYEKQTGPLRSATTRRANLADQPHPLAPTAADQQRQHRRRSVACRPSELPRPAADRRHLPVNPLASSNPLQTVALLQQETSGVIAGQRARLAGAPQGERRQPPGTSPTLQQVNTPSPPELLRGRRPAGRRSRRPPEPTTTTSARGRGIARRRRFKSAVGGLTYESVDLSLSTSSRNLTAGRPNTRHLDQPETRLEAEAGVYLQEEVRALETGRVLAVGWRAVEPQRRPAKYPLPQGGGTPCRWRRETPPSVRAAYGEAGNRPPMGRFTALPAQHYRRQGVHRATPETQDRAGAPRRSSRRRRPPRISAPRRATVPAQ